MKSRVLNRWIVRSHGSHVALVLSGALVAIALPRYLDVAAGNAGLRDLKLLGAWAVWLATTLVLSIVQLRRAARRSRAASRAGRRRRDASATMIESPAGITAGSGPSRTLPAAPTDETRVGPGGRYHSRRELGRGGMGVVYHALDTVLQREVALKELPHHVGGRGDLAERFRQEARVLAKLAHPNIVQVHDLLEEDGRVWIALEYVAGGTVADAMRYAGGALGWQEVVRIGEQIAEGLAFAHAQGVIHRDVKPLNILLTDTRPSLAKITDFGLARLVESTEHTVPGSLLGSARYMSPEQVAGKKADARSDLYAFGITLFEMLTGRVPFDGEFAAVLGRHANEAVPDVRTIVPDVPPALATLVASMVAKAPEDRPQDAGHVVFALRALAADSGDFQAAA